jgi:class 3 adenylate cyclase
MANAGERNTAFPGADPDSYDTTQQSSSFEIRALAGVGDLVKAGDKFDLVGRALPYRGVSFEVTQRISTTWYPGNPVALQQVMGATESNTTVNGVWKDRYIGDPSMATFNQLTKDTAFKPLGTGQADNLAYNFDLLCRYAVPIEVRMTIFVGGTEIGRPTVRRGLIKRLKITHDYASEISWEMEFEWRGRDQEAAKPVSVNLTDAREQLSNLAAQFADTADRMRDLQTKERTQLFGLPSGFSSTMNDITTALDKANEQITDTVAGVVGGIHANGGLLDNGNALRAVALLSQTMTNIQKGIDQIDALPLYATSVRDNALDLLTQEFDLLDLKRDLRQAFENARSSRDDFSGQLYQTNMAEAQVSGGTDLRDVAMTYYGDPDLWYAIAHANGLTSSRVPDNPDGPSDTYVQTLKIPQQTGVVSSVGDIC